MELKTDVGSKFPRGKSFRVGEVLPKRARFPIPCVPFVLWFPASSSPRSPPRRLAGPLARFRLRRPPAGPDTKQLIGQSHLRSFASQDAMEPNDVNLYLVGFMGTGKTTVSRIVAARLGHRWMDSDHEIERLRGQSVSEIFASDGEPVFRQLERDFVDHGHPAERTVVACGGGLVIQDGMLAELQRRGVVICLHATVETILRRTSGNRTRPLLDVEDPEKRVRDLYAAREPIYSRAGSVVLTDNRPQIEIVQHVMRVYRRDAEDFLAARGLWRRVSSSSGSPMPWSRASVSPIPFPRVDGK